MLLKQAYRRGWLGRTTSRLSAVLRITWERRPPWHSVARELEWQEPTREVPTAPGMPQAVTKALVIASSVDAAWKVVERMFPEDALRLRVVADEHRPPPALDDFEHPISRTPEGETLKAWAKVRETERRLAVAGWAMSRTAPGTQRHRVLAEDLVGAYFYSFEAAVQILKQEVGEGFEAWLAAHPNNTITFRAIRTIRTLAVHVEDIRSSSDVAINVVKGRGGTIERAWRLPSPSVETLRSLKRPKLREDELDAWRKQAKEEGAGYQMLMALQDLRAIVAAAEARPRVEADMPAVGDS